MAGPITWLGAKLGLLARRGESSQFAQEWLSAAADMGRQRLDGYALASDYYDGEQRVQLIEREREFLEASGLPFAENFCETIVDAMVNRLRVTGFGSESEPLAEFAKAFWRENRLDAGQKSVHMDAVKLGDGFVIVEPGADGELPRAYCNRPEQVKVVYDSGEPLYAVKAWTTRRVSASNPNGRPIRRMNIYWPDQVEKWFSLSGNGDWVPFSDSKGEDHSAWWTMDGTASGEPIGIPVVHFAHKPSAHYGRSKLRNVIPQQDGLNKQVVDLFWVMDAQGWPQQWAKGVGDDDLKRHPGSLWTVENDEAEFGQFEAADPTKANTSVESLIKRMASRSSTPLHQMLAGGNLPSGETLKTSESGLTGEVGGVHPPWGNNWEDVVTVGARIESAFGDGDPPLDATLDCRWEQAESRNEIDEANTAVLWRTLGVSEDTILSRLGFDPAEERRKRVRDGDDQNRAAEELRRRAEEMRTGGDPPQAPTRPEERGGGRQPDQDPNNARV